jgi:hypothetical protein
VFEGSQGSSKALTGEFLAGWLKSLHAREALTPEAREVLEQVKARVGELPQDLHERAVLWRELVSHIDESGEIGNRTVEDISKAIQRFPQSERHELATAVRDLLRTNGSKVSYSGEHALYDLPKRFEKAPAQAEMSAEAA